MSAQLALAWDAAESGMARATGHAESLEPGWSASVYRVLTVYAGHTAEFTALDFRRHLDRIGFPVPVPKALGGPFKKAARCGLITRIGFDPHPERHASPTPRYRSLIVRSAA